MNPALKWACTSLGSCAVSFASYAIPVLQVVALVVSIAAGIIAIRRGKK